MSMNFKVIEQDTIPYDVFKQAYLGGLRGEKYRKHFGIGTSQYKSLMKRFKEDNIIVHKATKKVNRKPRYYYLFKHNGYEYWIVRRIINGEKHYFGAFKTEQEAKDKVKELHRTGWGGLLG